jgi:hypothetical protein
VLLRRARARVTEELRRLVRPEIEGARAEIDATVRDSVGSLEAELGRAHEQQSDAVAASLDRIAAALDNVATQLASQALEHRSTVVAVEFLLREMVLASTVTSTLGAPSAQEPSAIIGGTIDPELIDDAPALPAGCIVEVRSRFQNRWVDGFEIVDIVRADGVERYRLARHADHMMLPVLFDPNDLRPLDRVADIVIDDMDIDDDGSTDADAAISLALDDPGNRR